MTHGLLRIAKTRASAAAPEATVAVWVAGKEDAPARAALVVVAVTVVASSVTVRVVAMALREAVMMAV